MLAAFRNHIEREFPFLKKSPLVIACSGGVDSVVLTHLCNALGYNLTLAHCNFSLRGIDSDSDEDFVMALGKKLSIPVRTITFDTEKERALRKESIQMTARALRYEWFEKLVSEDLGQYVLTGHHLDDTLETFLINLSRGTGIQGLTGIPKQQGFVVRPLLPFDRVTILAYAESEGLSWKEDQSNEDSKYLRNQVRHQVIPTLKEIRPDFLERFQDTLNHLQTTAHIQEDHIKTVREQLFQEEKGRILIDVDGLSQLPFLESYAFQLFSPYGFTEPKEVVKLTSAMSGKVLYSKTHQLLKDREYLILTERKEMDINGYEIEEGIESINIPISLRFQEANELNVTSQDIVFLDKEKLNYPLLLRKWKNGDYFYPLGMTGKKKVAKYFKDEKVDVFAKKEQWLLTSQGEVVWVIGKRMDHRFRVTEETQSILKIELSK